ncbi:monovalent cation/H+ antiporter complex subunit F [Ilumatobacter coccineus]|jgi:multicomponent Na+:H+ antiporter subunit F|uniref:Na(+)/H(+) antiporter subunit F n=1 Tax=Ilumatobacter coccineus (strain NBRC 103263 / KCTC 29153 / YM16-304) TaxID=1313172 RepID=A0A6C7ECL9_ILUCY|nr:monovalent cation/H+ antiporter complex subunit F [Ilumatobacter coccineus]BAN04120.1 Na(+)/H(+) antiporter subunit F [Ilumatobacter coccineus YM16-304]
MNTAALVITSLAGLLFIARLLRGPALPDRVISVDGFVSTIVIGVTVASARPGTGVIESTVLVVALGGFVGTAVLARFIERRGG